MYILSSTQILFTIKAIGAHCIIASRERKYYTRNLTYFTKLTSVITIIGKRIVIGIFLFRKDAGV